MGPTILKFSKFFKFCEIYIYKKYIQFRVALHFELVLIILRKKDNPLVYTNDLMYDFSTFFKFNIKNSTLLCMYRVRGKVQIYLVHFWEIEQTYVLNYHMWYANILNHTSEILMSLSLKN